MIKIFLMWLNKLSQPFFFRIERIVCIHIITKKIVVKETKSFFFLLHILRKKGCKNTFYAYVTFLHKITRIRTNKDFAANKIKKAKANAKIRNILFIPSLFKAYCNIFLKLVQ